MTLLISSDALAERRLTARGALAPLAQSLRHDLEPLLDRGFEIPHVKALLSRDGGRCARHGALLAFDPYRPHEHACPVDGEIVRGERHDRWWVMAYQLWLAERAVHAALLHTLVGGSALGELASRILEGYADQYLRYPNRDNVLGPTRPFFSTYLESIWMLELAIALDLLETSGNHSAVGGAVRERVLRPSMELIASYDEGQSNRQVWNDAALVAAGALLGERAIVHRALTGRSGLLALLAGALLPDGTWYEGENYHFFAHRGLWYGVTMAGRLGVEIPRTLEARFDEGFAAPLATALPDFTFPARRDAQYGVSLRQWRFAESCELGLARRDDARLVGALWELYENADASRRDTGRWRSTAEAERNEPPSALGRADLGWRSLLLACDTLPALAPAPRGSALLEGQGIAVLRRDGGRVYAALDYGHSGGGHGHPDRLNVLLSRDAERWLDDPGTGSYVDPSLHWYRSTLAHNAPLIDGRSQERVDGVLRAFDERGGVGWVDAEVPRGGIAPGVHVRRSLVAMPDYAVDRVAWESDASVCFELPGHAGAAVAGVAPFREAPLVGGPAPADGFSFVHTTAVAQVAPGQGVRLERESRTIGWMFASAESELWTGLAPGPPGCGEQPLWLLRMRGHGGTITTVWNWSAPITGVALDASALAVDLADGSRHEHTPRDDAWHVALFAAGARSSVDLLGARPAPARAAPLGRAPAGDGAVDITRIPRAPALPIAYELGESAYRISEDSWREAGAPIAVVALRVEEDALVITAEVRKSTILFRPRDALDPALDNEHPDIHSDGVQLYLAVPAASHAAAWLAVPETEDRSEPGRVRLRLVDGARRDLPLAASWRHVSGGYCVRFAIPLAALADARDQPLALEVVVNDMAPGRERRRGQLALSGGAGEYVYLRGDREPAERFRRFLLPHD